MLHIEVTTTTTIGAAATKGISAAHQIHVAAIVTGGAAIATVGATIVLAIYAARQINLGRAAVDATLKAAEATRAEAEATSAAVDVAAKQLEVSRVANEQTQVLAKEAIRARIDQQAPRVIITRSIRAGAVWEPSVAGGAPNEIGQDLAYVVPGQAGSRFFVQSTVYFRNEGRSGAQCRVAETNCPQGFVIRTPNARLPASATEKTTAQTSTGTEPRGIWPGDDGAVVVELEGPIDKWLDAQPVTATVTIEVRDVYSIGIVDQVVVTLTASAAERDPADAGKVRRTSAQFPVSVAIGEVTRQYRGV